MTTSTRPSRVPLLRRWLAERRDRNDQSDRSRVLDYVDQAMFLGLRATGQAAVMQCVWVYEHPVDMEGLRRFHYNFGHGLAGRRIEPSILPFGRHRWVSSLGPPAPMRVYETVRPRAELGDFLDEHAQIPVDPEFGPAWHMGVQSLDDGATWVLQLSPTTENSYRGFGDHPKALRVLFWAGAVAVDLQRRVPRERRAPLHQLQTPIRPAPRRKQFKLSRPRTRSNLPIYIYQSLISLGILIMARTAVSWQAGV